MEASMLNYHYHHHYNYYHHHYENHYFYHHHHYYHYHYYYYYYYYYRYCLNSYYYFIHTILGLNVEPCRSSPMYTSLLGSDSLLKRDMTPSMESTKSSRSLARKKNIKLLNPTFLPIQKVVRQQYTCGVGWFLLISKHTFSGLLEICLWSIKWFKQLHVPCKLHNDN